MSGKHRRDRIKHPEGSVCGYAPNGLKDEDGYISPHRRLPDPAWGLPPKPRANPPRDETDVKPKRDAKGRFIG